MSAPIPDCRSGKSPTRTRPATRRNQNAAITREVFQNANQLVPETLMEAFRMRIAYAMLIGITVSCALCGVDGDSAQSQVAPLPMAQIGAADV